MFEGASDGTGDLSPKPVLPSSLTGLADELLVDVGWPVVPSELSWCVVSLMLSDLLFWWVTEHRQSFPSSLRS
jgi:hypothetical protein